MTPPGAIARQPAIPTLQSLRGIAALVVLLHHAAFVFATTPGFRYASEVLFNAHAAVVVFFILSGFVLCRSLVQAPIDARAVVRFWLRRGFRIYPAAWLACLGGLACLVLLAGYPTPHESAWFARIYPAVRLAPADIFANFAVAKTALVPPLWSVRIELLMSVLMPLVVLLARGRGGIAVLAASAAACLWLGTVHPLLNYGFAFALGAFVAARPGRLTPGLAVGTIAVLALLFFRRIDHGWDFEIAYEAVVPTFVETIAGGMVVAWLAGGRGVPVLLLSWPLIGLGDISYSLYVLHFPILTALSKLPLFAALSPDAAALLLMALTVAVTLPLALLSWRWIERPGIELGQRCIAPYRGQ